MQEESRKSIKHLTVKRYNQITCTENRLISLTQCTIVVKKIEHLLLTLRKIIVEEIF